MCTRSARVEVTLHLAPDQLTHQSKASKRQRMRQASPHPWIHVAICDRLCDPTSACAIMCIVDARVLVGARDHEAAAAAQHMTDRTQGLTWLAGSGELTHTHCSVERRLG